MGLLLSSAIGPEHEILVDDHAQRPTGADGDGRLDVEVSLGDALASAVGVLLGGFPQRPDQIALLTAEAELGADAEDGQRVVPVLDHLVRTPAEQDVDALPDAEPLPALAEVRDAMGAGLAARPVGEGTLDEDEEVGLLAEIDELIRQYGAGTAAEPLIRLE